MTPIQSMALATPARNGKLQPLVPREVESPPPPPQPQSSFSIADLGRSGYRLRLPFAQYLLGLGTTGSVTVQAVIQRLLAELGRARLPGSMNYLLLDAATSQAGMDLDHFSQIEGSVDGAGSDPHRGHRLFHNEKNYHQLRHTLNSHLVAMMHNDPDLPWELSPRQTCNFLIVSGFGGTSGGILHDVVGVLHDVAQDRTLQNPRVRLYLVGPEIALRDRTRQVSIEQARMVRANAVCNLIKILGDMTNSGLIQEQRPDGTTFALRAKDRIWSVTFVDQSNGLAEFSTVRGLVDMLANCLFLQLFTQAGAYHAERTCDLHHTGAFGKPQGD